MRAIAIMGLVRRLLAYEASAGQAQVSSTQKQDAVIEAAERASDKLRTHLSKRIGQEGFRTLLARALALTTSQFPQLIAVRVGADGSLVGLRGAGGQASHNRGDSETRDSQARNNAVEGAVALVAHLIGLLIVFIGEDLTRRILSTVWPELAWDDAAGWENDTP